MCVCVWGGYLPSYKGVLQHIGNRQCYATLKLSRTDGQTDTCDIPWYWAFPRNPFIINISMYFGATEKWHVQMVMVSRVVQLAGALDAPSGTHVTNRPVYAVISVMPDV